MGIYCQGPNDINEYYIEDFVFDDDTLLTSAKRKNWKTVAEVGSKNGARRTICLVGERISISD